MTEQGKSESHYVPEHARIMTLDNFRKNFATFLDGKDNVTLSSFSFQQCVEPLQVWFCMGICPMPFEYRNLDERFEEIIKPYVKSGSTPIRLNERHTLAEFPDMPPKLKEFVGKDIQAVSTLFELTGFDEEQEIVARTRYLYTCGSKPASIAEIWTAKRTPQLQDQRATRPGIAIDIPKRIRQRIDIKPLNPPY